MAVLNVMKTKPEATDSKPLKILLASNAVQRMAPLAEGLWTSVAAELYQAGSAVEVMELLQSKPIELVVIDEELTDVDGLELARLIARQQPFVNCMLVSTLAAKDFHEETEGLGVLMQLGSPPAMEASRSILKHLSAIKVTQLVA